MEGGLDSASIFLVVLSILDFKAFSGYIISVLLLSIGVGFLFRDIINCSKIKPAILLRGLKRI